MLCLSLSMYWEIQRVVVKEAHFSPLSGILLVPSPRRLLRVLLISKNGRPSALNTCDLLVPASLLDLLLAPQIEISCDA